MTCRILKYGDPLLHEPASRVADGDPDLSAMIDELVSTMYAAPGVGLAAPQIGVAKRVFAVDVSAGRSPGDLLVLVNPEYVHREGLLLEVEGCLSVPGFQATVARAATVRVRGLDRAGEVTTVQAQGLLARALQHEMDHLNGVLFIDRLRPIRRKLILRRIDRLQRAGRW
jgi:peptide deformylase